jgi:hypothetical protein
MMKYAIILFLGLTACDGKVVPPPPPAAIVSAPVLPPATPAPSVVAAPVIAPPEIEERAVMKGWIKTFTVYPTPDLRLTVEARDFGLGEAYVDYTGKIQDIHDSAKWTIFDISKPQDKIWDAHVLATVQPVLNRVLAAAHADYGKYPAVLDDDEGKRQCVTVTANRDMSIK